MNNQEAFTTSVLGVIKQGKPAYDAEDDNCFYRTHDGLKCAIGQLIPDDQYDDGIEGALPRHLIEGIGASKPIPALVGLNALILADLQSAHDDAAREVDDSEFVAEFTNRARYVAITHGLTFPTLPI